MISIVTPIYNGRSYIEACIRSVIDQNCPEVEHILVDGGSTDGTVEIIREYAAQFPHIRWVSEKDRGQSDAMNKGIAMARGEILGILNVDDTYEPGVLNRILPLMKSLPSPAFLVGNCNVLDHDGNLFDLNKPKHHKFWQLLLGPVICPYPINPSAYFCHASLLDKTGNYNENYHMELDLDFILRAVQCAHVKYCDETWGNFRLYEGTKTWNDMQRGVNRSTHLMREYREKLPRLQRWMVMLLYPIFNNRLSAPILYFWRRPKELLPRFLALVKKHSGGSVP
jgi:glycosyltransferase involved in cell wall biosynthesis